MTDTLGNVAEAMRNSESIRGYIADRLSEAERADLEKRLLVDFELVRDFETSLRLREGLERLREQGSLRGLTHPGRAPRWRMASAAVGALAAVALSLGYFHGRAAPVVTAGSPLSVAGHYSFVLMRSATEPPTVTLPTAGALELRALTTAIGNKDTFRVALEESGPTAQISRIGVVDHVVPDADGFVAIYLDAARVAPGVYALVVEADAAGTTPAEHFVFRLQRADAATPRGE